MHQSDELCIKNPSSRKQIFFDEAILDEDFSSMVWTIGDTPI